jgi:hypothetical protein
MLSHPYANEQRERERGRESGREKRVDPNLYRNKHKNNITSCVIVTPHIQICVGVCRKYNQIKWLLYLRFSYTKLIKIWFIIEKKKKNLQYVASWYYILHVKDIYEQFFVR